MIQLKKFGTHTILTLFFISNIFKGYLCFPLDRLRFISCKPFTIITIQTQYKNRIIQTNNFFLTFYTEKFLDIEHMNDYHICIFILINSYMIDLHLQCINEQLYHLKYQEIFHSPSLTISFTFLTQRQFPPISATPLTGTGLVVTSLGYVTMFTAVFETIFSVQFRRTFFEVKYWKSMHKQHI